MRLHQRISMLPVSLTGYYYAYQFLFTASMKKMVGLLGLCLLSACSSKTTSADDILITANDFEATAGWNDNLALLTRKYAHSGQYAITVDKEHEFSLTYQIPLDTVSSQKRIKTLHLEAWAYLLSDKSSGDLVLQISDPAQNNKNTLYETIKLGEAVRTYNNWTLVSKDIPVPNEVTAAQQMKIYLWRSSASEPVFVDDLKVSGKL